MVCTLFLSPNREEGLLLCGVGKLFPELCFLFLNYNVRNKMTNDDLLAILGECNHLESFNIRQCSNIDLDGSLEKRCKRTDQVFKASK